MFVIAALLLLLTYVAGYETLTEDEVIRRVKGHLIDALIDLRTPTEWAAGHLPGADFVWFHPGATEPFNVSMLSGCEHCRVITYCKTGVRAGDGAAMLERAGFTAVANGLGVEQWTAAGMALVNTPSLKPSCVGTGVCAPVVAPNMLDAITNLNPMSSSVPDGDEGGGEAHTHDVEPVVM